MTGLQKHKIFISSTYLDLAEVRSAIAQWLSGIFGTEFIIMETFGSDADPPAVYSVRRVGECDLFIGIYAHRYGTIDKDTGKSITELELDEAKAAFSSGVLKDILLYVIHKDSDWKSEHKDTSQLAQAGLQRLKEKSRSHTNTSFKSGEDLLYFIVRDVYRKLHEHFGTQPLKVRLFILPSQRSLCQPVGMEFLTSEYRSYLVGREKEAAQLVNLLEDDPMVLLLGDSGVGKTSLVHAALIPITQEFGYRPIYTRPLGLPCTDIVRKIQASIFEGRTGGRGPLVSLLAEVAGTLVDEKVLLIIDQFEDVLMARDSRETEMLVSELRTLRELASPLLRILISYRADLEGRLGEFWQQISGSPQGLPRVYIGGVDKEAAWNGVKQVGTDLAVDINLRSVEQNRLKEDLFVVSRALGVSGVYPPYIQMLIDHIWTSSNKGQIQYTLKNYQVAGGMEGVVGGYLSRQLEYAQDAQGHVRAVLTSLVRSYGVKDQRSIDEIVSDTGLDKRDCEISLEKLIDLRLVRHIDTFYEISHDFIARKILEELIDSEEREFKRFRELLLTKAAAFQTTEAPLAREELLMLYKHRRRFAPKEAELRLLLFSWIKQIGPGLYWLLNADKAKLLDWLRAEESKEELTRDEKVSIVLLRRKLGETALVGDDYSVFRGYQLSAEMSTLILEDAVQASKKLLMYGLRHRRNEVKEASKNAIALQIKHGKFEWIEQLRKSSSQSCQQTYYGLILRNEVTIPEEIGGQNRAYREFILLKKLTSASIGSEARIVFDELVEMRIPARILIFGKALLLIRNGRIRQLIKEAKRVSKDKAEVLFAGISKNISSEDFDLIVSEYEEWNSREKERYETPSAYAKASGLAAAILRSASYERLPRLREAMKTIPLALSSRDIVMALLKYGDLDDVKLVLDRIAGSEKEVDFWNHTELGQTVARRMEEIGGGIPQFLKEIKSKKEFWEYISPQERPNRPEKDLLLLKNRDNRSLYLRLAAYAMIGIAERQDQEDLIKLANHNYGLIARTATIRLVRSIREKALDLLSSTVDDVIQKGKSTSLAEALRAAELELYDVARLSTFDNLTNVPNKLLHRDSGHFAAFTHE